MVLFSPSVISASRDQLGTHGRTRKGNRSKSKTNQNCEPEVATPSVSEAVGDEVVDHDVIDVDQSSSDVERADGLMPDANTLMRDEANNFFPLLPHTHKNPFGESCRRAKMKEKRKYVGSFKSTAI